MDVDPTPKYYYLKEVAGEVPYNIDVIWKTFENDTSALKKEAY